MEGYTDTILVDCNRLNSEEKKAGNKTTPAIFTNKIGSGLKLNVGDKVSVHSGFISERGAGGGVIELTGKPQKPTYSLTETTLGKFQPRYAGGKKASRYGELQPFGHYCVTQTPTTKTYTLQDNIGHIQINYYKTTNGEGYFHLPRRFDAAKTEFIPVPIDRSGIPKAGDRTPAGESFEDVYKYSVPMPPGWYNLFNNNASAAVAPHNVGQLDDRYNNGRVKTNYMHDYARCNADVNYYFDPSRDVFAGTPTFDSSRMWKKKNNNSRYTLFVKEISYFAEWTCTGKFGGQVDNIDYVNPGYEGTSTINTTRSRDDYHSSAGVADVLHPRDPALSQYNRYTEIKEINIDTLHSAPENIADAVTNQLNKITTDEHIRGEVGGTFRFGANNPTPAGATSYVGNAKRDIEANYGSDTYPYYGIPVLPPEFGQQSSVGVNIARRLESECMKTFACANPLTFSKEYYESYWSNDTAVPDAATTLNNNLYNNQDKVQNYMSSYTTIGIKRPDLFEELRNVAALSPGKSGGLPLNGVGVTGKGSSWRNMYCPWVMNGAVVKVPQTPTSLNILGSTRATADMILSYEWNETNLEALKKYFDVQGKYPDLWEYNGGNANLSLDDAIVDTGLTPDNSRYWHMNPLDGQSDLNNKFNLIGNDNYENTLGNTPSSGEFTNQQSLPLFFYFDKTRKDIANGGTGVNDLYYGMFIRRRGFFPTNTPENQYDCIGVTMEKVGGTPDYFFGQTNQIDQPPPSPTSTTILGNSFSRAIGVDIHFNAYGTDAICLYTGMLDAPGQDALAKEGIFKEPSDRGIANQVYYEHDEAPGKAPENISDRGICTKDQGYYMTSIQIRERYCGAESPQLSFDTSASRFNFKALHTPENVGNDPQAGYPATAAGTDAQPIVAAAGDIAIKINKRLFKTSYCPDMIPYQNEYVTNYSVPWAGDTTNAGSTPNPLEGKKGVVTPYNSNLEKWCPYDADGGIQIEGFGLTEEDWDNSFWGILGFSYDQFNNPNTLSTQTRMLDGTNTKDIGLITTNAILSAGDIKKFTTNINGAPLFNMDVGITTVGMGPAEDHNYYNDNPLLPHNHPSPPPITISPSISSQINAINLPRKMIRPYFLIKSNIVGNVNYLGGEDSGQGLPVIYIVNKENGFGDFYFQSQSQNEFTITKDVVLSSITTSIHEADYSLASVDDNSAIIYKITKQVQANMNVAQEVMAKLQKKK